MRIIAGKKKGRKLISPKDKTARPTEDRIKEALFNIISDSIDNAVVLDLFGGSGALGCEALSRGAKKVYFNELRSENYKIIKTNIDNLDFNDSAIVNRGDYRNYLKKLSGKEVFDIVFLDPPYGRGFEFKSLELIHEYDILSKNGFIVLETDKYVKELKGYDIIDERKYGNIYLFFLKKEVFDDSNIPG